MTPLMSPQSIEPRSDELLATTQSSNTTRTWTTSKRPITSNDNESAEVAEASLLDRELSAVVENVGRINKRFKHVHVVLRLEVQSTRSIDPILAESDVIIQSVHKASSGAGGVGNSSQPIDQTIQARQEHEQHQAPRPSLSSMSSLTNVESQIPAIFSPKERILDTQSVHSQVTAQSTYTTYPPGGKNCRTCIKLLTKGYFSEWKNHYWPIHCPQEGYYCLPCKLGIVTNEEQGTLFWQCKKCLDIFQNDPEAVAHFTDRNLPCYDRTAMWLRTRPWEKHLQAHIVDVSTGLMMCKACQETFSNTSLTQKHKCRKLEEWKYQLSTPIYTTCEDHGIILTTFDQVNHHYDMEHFKQSPPRSRRNRTNAGSTIADDDSRLDNYSLDGLDPFFIGQQDHGLMIPSHTESEAFCNQHFQVGTQQCNAVKDPAVDLREIGQKSTLQDLFYPQGDITMGDETGPLSNKSEHLAPPGELPSGREPPPLLTNVVTEDGKAKFLTR